MQQLGIQKKNGKWKGRRWWSGEAKIDLAFKREAFKSSRQTLSSAGLVSLEEEEEEGQAAGKSWLYCIGEAAAISRRHAGEPSCHLPSSPCVRMGEGPDAAGEGKREGAE